MNANEIFQNMIGSELEGLVVKYTPYNENFDVHPYRQSITTDLKNSSLICCSIVLFFMHSKKKRLKKII